MTFKNHGPGGCCCGGCPFWEDGFNANGWNIDDDGHIAWMPPSSDMTISEGGGAMIGSQGSSGPSLQYAPYSQYGPQWDIGYGYNAGIIANVDYGHIVIGDDGYGLLFDVATMKAYPFAKNLLSQPSIVGQGVEFDCEYPFNMNMTKASNPQTSSQSSPLTYEQSIVQVNATDRAGRTIDYRFQSVQRSSIQNTGIAINSYPTIRRGLLRNETTSGAYYPAIIPTESPSYTDRQCQWRLHDISVEAVSNVVRQTATGNPPVIPNLTSGEVSSCNNVDEWFIDDWIEPPPGLALPGYKQRLLLNSSGDINLSEDRYVSQCFINPPTGSPYDGYDGVNVFGGDPNLPIQIPSNMVIWFGTLAKRYFYLAAPNSIVIVDQYNMNTAGTGDICTIRWYFDIGTVGNRTFPFELTNDDAYFADVDVGNASAAISIDAADVWASKGDITWTIELIKRIDNGTI